MTFDPTKPVQTRDGRSVRILCTDMKSSTPIVGIISVSGEPELVVVRASDGSYAPHKEHPYDFVNVPEKRQANVWKTGTDLLYVGSFWRPVSDCEHDRRSGFNYIGYFECDWIDDKAENIRYVPLKGE